MAVIQWFADPIRVITEIAKIKVESNRLQQNINEELNRRQNLRSNTCQTIALYNESNQMSEDFQKGANIERIVRYSVPSLDGSVVTNINIFEINANQPNTSSSPSGLFSAQSPESNPFGAEGSVKSDDSDVRQQNIFSLFGNQSAATSSANASALGLFGNQSAATSSAIPLTFSLFGNQSAATSPTNPSSFNLFGNQSPPEGNNNGSGFGFGNLFGNGSEAGASSPNRSEESFNFFK